MSTSEDVKLEEERIRKRGEARKREEALDKARKREEALDQEKYRQFEFEMRKRYAAKYPYGSPYGVHERPYPYKW